MVATALVAGLVAKEVVVASLAQAAGATGVVAVLAGAGLQALIAWVLAVAVFWGGRAAGL